MCCILATESYLDLEEGREVPREVGSAIPWILLPGPPVFSTAASAAVRRPAVLSRGGKAHCETKRRSEAVPLSAIFRRPQHAPFVYPLLLPAG